MLTSWSNSLSYCRERCPTQDCLCFAKSSYVVQRFDKYIVARRQLVDHRHGNCCYNWFHWNIASAKRPVPWVLDMRYDVRMINWTSRYNSLTDSILAIRKFLSSFNTLIQFDLGTAWIFCSPQYDTWKGFVPWSYTVGAISLVYTHKNHICCVVIPSHMNCKSWVA